MKRRLILRTGIVHILYLPEGFRQMDHILLQPCDQITVPGLFLQTGSQNQVGFPVVILKYMGIPLLNILRISVIIRQRTSKRVHKRPRRMIRHGNSHAPVPGGEIQVIFSVPAGRVHGPALIQLSAVKFLRINRPLQLPVDQILRRPDLPVLHTEAFRIARRVVGGVQVRLPLKDMDMRITDSLSENQRVHPIPPYAMDAS